MRETLYRKVGRRYYPVDEWCIGNPADGLWIVETKSGGKSMTNITKRKISELPEAISLAKLFRNQDELANIIVKALKILPNKYSAMDLARAILNIIHKDYKEKQNKK